MLEDLRRENPSWEADEIVAACEQAILSQFKTPGHYCIENESIYKWFHERSKR